MCVFHRLRLFERAAGVVGGNRVWCLAGGSLRRLRMVSTQAGELHTHLLRRKQFMTIMYVHLFEQWGGTFVVC